MIRVITEGAEDEQDKFSEAIIASIEVNILTAIINVCEANHEEMELVECTFLLGKIGKSIATITCLLVSLKRHQAQVHQKIAAHLDELWSRKSKQRRSRELVNRAACPSTDLQDYPMNLSPRCFTFINSTGAATIDRALKLAGLSGRLAKSLLPRWRWLTIVLRPRPVLVVVLTE
ncbi:MAG: hypothetical protein ACTS77_01465 [Arsenophonus sp. NC-TX2-MAG3]